ncbi:ribbon-helix-helix protein, CopG family [Phenylobacterium sp.]|uniref:ribbon-helix-helix protein, CopG family n=1 Tax=Phenylobacterium sp. TaxID=1871053 RepID=UPI0035B05BE2
MSPKHIQTKVFLPPDLVRRLDEQAKRLRRPKSEIVRAAVAAWLSADGPEQLEAALARRLDRLSRQAERLERDLLIANESQALFIRAWLTATPPLADADRPAAEAKGRERYAGFVEALGRRIAGGRSLAAEVLEDRGRPSDGLGG